MMDIFKTNMSRVCLRYAGLKNRQLTSNSNYWHLLLNKEDVGGRGY